MEFDGTEYNPEHFKPDPKPIVIRLKGKPYKRLQLEVLERDGNRCQTCGEYSKSPPHHIVYVGKGGSDIASNMATECDLCHYQIHHGTMQVVIDRMIRFHGLKQLLRYFLKGIVSEKEKA